MLAPATRKVTLPNNWTPRHYQLKAWKKWELGVKRLLKIWPRRAGKDDVGLNMAACAMHPSPANEMPNARIGNYWHCLPMFEQARKAIWEAVNPHTGKRRIDEAFPLALRKSTRNDNMSIEFLNGSHWRVVGSDNPNSLVGASPFGIVFSEWDLSNPSSWVYLAPMLAENGGWAVFNTTPRGRGNAYRMWNEHKDNPNWFVERLTWDVIQHVPRERIEEDRRDYVALFGHEAAEALILQEYWCSFEAAILGAFYGRSLVDADEQGRITDGVVYDPDFPVHTAWDLGVDDPTAIWWFQPKLGGTIAVLDYYEAAGYTVGHYAEVIEQRARTYGWQRGTDYVPHDAKMREFTSSGRDGKAKQRIEVMIECGLKPKVVPNHQVIDGISAARQVLPKCWFHAARCEEGLEALRQYRAEWDDDLKVFKKQALHDWASHGADAFRYLAMAYREIVPVPAKPEDRMLAVNAGGGANQVTLEDLWALRPKRSRRI